MDHPGGPAGIPGLYRTAPAVITLLASAAIAWYAQDHVFFWDTVQLGAKQAYWFYDHGPGNLLLPPEIDSGHPPLFGLYLAGLWKLFGKSLPVSHWAMLPFLWGSLWFAYRIGERLGGRRSAWFLTLLLLADPVFMGQAVLVSPDVTLVCAFLAAFYGILSRERTILTLALLPLALISMRGMMCVLLLYAFDTLGDTSLWISGRSLFRQALKKLPAYLPAALLAAVFLLYHYRQTGWLGYHADSPWAPSFERVDLYGIFRNAGILGWRTLDYGRIFECLAILIGWRILWRRPAVYRLEMAPWLILVLLSLLILSPSFLLHRSLSAHRYLLPFFIALHLFMFQLLLLLPTSYRRRRRWLAPILIGLVSGNFWIYPRPIAQGWDATPAHLPYYDLREEMMDFIARENIPLDSIGTVFPEIGPLKFRDLSDREEGMKKAEIGRDRYIFYASVMNDFTDEALVRLEKEYLPLYRPSQNRIQTILYIRQ